MGSHAYKRALERYGLRLDSDDFAEMRRQITDGEATKIRRLTKKKSIYILIIRDVPIVVIVHRQNRFVITVLPWEFADAAGYEVVII